MTATQPRRAAAAHEPNQLAAGRENHEGLRHAATLVIVAGVGLRLLEYFSRFPLWADEARVALNVGRRSWLELALPLDHDQAAPIPFVWSLRLAAKLFGMNELALRLVPLLAGVALLPVMWRLGRRWFGDRAALIAVGFAAASPLLIRYSNEVKQYSLDGLATLVALLLALAFLERSTSPWGWLGLALGGAGLVAVSHPIPFILAGCGLCLLASAETRALPGFLRRWLATTLLWLTVFFAVYLTGYRSVSRSRYMQAFWSGSYLDPTTSDFGDRAIRAVNGMLPLELSGHLGNLLALLLATGFVGGMTVLGRRSNRTTFVLFAAPFVAFAMASALRFYPVADRLTLFLVPLVCLVTAVGVDATVPRLGRGGRFLLPGILLVCGVQAALLASQTVRRASAPRTSRDLIRRFESSAGTDPVYVYAGGIPTWTFYMTDWSAPDQERLTRIARLVAADGPSFTNLPARGRQVFCEGDSLITRHRGREELLGLGAGVGFVMPFRRWARSTDAGWAENEVRRMRQTGRERVWLMALYIQDSWLNELLAAAQAVGAVPETTLVAGGGDRYRGVLVPLRFNPAASLPESPCHREVSGPAVETPGER